MYFITAYAGIKYNLLFQLYYHTLKYDSITEIKFILVLSPAEAGMFSIIAIKPN